MNDECYSDAIRTDWTSLVVMNIGRFVSQVDYLTYIVDDIGKCTLKPIRNGNEVFQPSLTSSPTLRGYWHLTEHGLAYILIPFWPLYFFEW